jgi:hypothetical protein
MKAWLNRRTWGILGLSAALMGGLLTAGLTAASAAPHSYRDQDRDGISNRWDRDRDGDRIRNRRDRDRDGDGIRNRWDRHPNRSDRYDGRPRRDWDRDRDGIPNRWDRDRDGDGVPNWRDRRPDDRHRR